MPTSEKIAARAILTFREPRPIAFVQKTGFLLNRVFNLALGVSGVGRIRPRIAPRELCALRALPPGAGNLLVGPHPGSHDPFLMFDLCARARATSACFLIAAEPFYRRSRLSQTLLRWMGAIPVARGRGNPEVVDHVIRALSEGKWAGIYPEGEVYYSRDVMPMEYGAVRIAVSAALRVQEQARARGIPRQRWRPVLITPFAHAYFFTDESRSLRRIQAVLAELESRPELFGEAQPGDFRARLRGLAGRVMEYKGEHYGVPREQWEANDRFDRAHKLQEVVLSDLERRYLGHVQAGYPRRRALKVRMKLFELLRDSRRSEASEREIYTDVQKTRDIVMVAPFSREYLEKYGDLEMWGEYLRRLRNSLGMGEPNLGAQTVVFKILPNLDAHRIATRYRALDSVTERQSYLYETTQALRDTIQEGVDAICREHPTVKMPAPRGPE